MSKTFLNKEQKKYLKESGWETFPTILSKDGAIWFGQEWDSKRNSLVEISGRFPNLLKEWDKSIRGYDFLIVALRPNKGDQ